MFERRNETASTAEVEIPLIEYNLSLSFEERLERHQAALNLLIDLRNAGERLRSAENETRYLAAVRELTIIMDQNNKK